MNVLIICEGKITRLGRVRRTIELLQEMNANIYSLSGENSNEYQFVSQMLLPKMSLSSVKRLGRFLLRILRWMVHFYGVRKSITKTITGLSLNIVTENAKWDIIIVEHIDFLPLACELKKKQGGRILFDVRDFYPREFEKYFMFKWLEAGYRKQVFKHLLIECDVVITVSKGLVKGLKEEYGITSHLIRSIPSYANLTPTSMQPNVIRLVHHGSANADRLLGEMIKMVKKLDKRFTLDFYLVGSDEEINKLKEIAGDSKAIRFNQPVSFDRLLRELNKYDAGLFFFVPTTFNIRHCLPNKLFEVIQARLMVITSPIDGIADIVKEYECGLVLPSFDFESAISLINKLTETDVYHGKQAANLAANVLCFEEEKKKLYAIMQSILN